MTPVEGLLLVDMPPGVTSPDGGDGVRRGRDVVRGDLTDAGDGAQDDVELAGEQVELTIGDGEPGEPGEVRDLVPADRARGVGGHVPPRCCGTHSLGGGTDNL